MSIHTLTETCTSILENTDRASVWLEANQNLVQGEYDNLQAELRRAARFFKKSRIAADRKMCAGVFGPSQAGKSYLISALARDADGNLIADFDGTGYDFISKINPEGGKESTGLVTRFTLTHFPTPDGFPVRLRLLTEMDIVKTLANTYYADCEHSEEPNSQAILARLDKLEKLAASSGSSPDLDDFEELRDYLEKDFRAQARVQELRRSYWTRAIEIGPKLPLSDRITLYSLIWNETPGFTNLLQKLVLPLDILGNPDIAYAPLSTLIPRESSIIDVANLSGLENPENAELVEVVAENGRRTTISKVMLTALTAELTIMMQEKPDDYFDYTDLLDFPGYRSRYKITDLNHELEKDSKNIEQLFLRGKVAYLFQRYVAERELTAILLCIASSIQEVQSLPGVIDDWIRLTHGEKPENRQNKDVSLFFVLTKCDTEFGEKKGAASVETRWDTRLHASLLDFFGTQHDWPTNWDGQHAFNNLFLLRNPNYKFSAVLNFDEKGQEQGIRADQQKNVDALRHAFLSSSLVAAHFANPQESWDALMSLNDGGINLLRNKLRPLCNPDIKRRQLALTIKERLDRLIGRFVPFWKNDDKAEERKQKMAFAVHLLRDILLKMKDPSSLGELTRRMTVTDQEIYDLYFEVKFRMINEKATEQTNVIINDTLDANSILNDLFDEELFAPSANSTETSATTEERFKDEPAYFASIIESWWLNRLHHIAENPLFQKRYNFPAADFACFVNELAIGANRHQLRQRMENAMRQASAFVDIDPERLVWKEASLAAAEINAYVDFLGYDPKTVPAEARSIVKNAHTVVLFEPPTAIHTYPILSEARSTSGSTWINNWVRAIRLLIDDNLNFEGGLSFDPVQNDILGEILHNLRSFAA